MRILYISNSASSEYSFRKELIQALIAAGDSVHMALPAGKAEEKLIELGCNIEEIDVDRHGMNPVTDIKLLHSYEKLIRRIAPDIVLTYTVKPNVYGGMACRLLKVPYIANVTGLGTAIENGGLRQKIVVLLYKLGTKGAQKVFYQNTGNMACMLQYGMQEKIAALLPGSGVNLQQHCFEPYPEEDISRKLLFLIIGRIMRDKGTDEVLYAAEMIKKEYPNVVFRFLGGYDGAYQEKIEAAVAKGIIEYPGLVENVHMHIKESHATIHASYHEGMSNALLESAASGRPVIATDIPGCRETFEDGVSGLACQPRDGESLVNAIKRFIELPYTEKIQMGLAGRVKMEREFDRQIVVNKYLEEIEKIGEK